jgi:UDP-N-acetylmuramoylalanine--D-glutamate ligase
VNLPISKARLLGEHNQQNLRLAATTLSLLGLPVEDQKTLLEYPGLPHRTEYVTEKNGIHFINDSKATSIESVLVSVEACLKNVEPGGKIHLLLGGRDKNLPWQDLNELISHKNIFYYFFGESKSLIPQKTKLVGSEFTDVESCFKSALSHSKKGDWILFSPGGTSLDQFKNFEERGNFFKSLVKEMAAIVTAKK